MREEVTKAKKTAEETPKEGSNRRQKLLKKT
jgi:hypothetical protein